MDFSEIPNKLDVTLYGNLEYVTETLSKCRVRIFYKGMNRNRTYISEDFANQLISSLPYTPVKGIFNVDDMDFEDHGERNTDGRIYGIVMAEPNFAWEFHLDEDGVEREYACADVLLFTGLYPQAKLIIGESQSMEIFRNGLQGEWRIYEMDHQPYFYFLKGSLVGLQVLGTDVEPCFEGAAFFNNSNLKQIETIQDLITQYKQEVREKKMDEKNEVIKDEVDTMSLSTEIENVTTNYNSENTSILNDHIEIETKINQTEIEKNNFEKEIAELKDNIDKLNSIITDYTKKIEILENEKAEIEKINSSISAENELLNEFKRKIEREKKEEILDEYSDYLKGTSIQELKSKIDNFSIEDFKKEVCTVALDNNIGILSSKNSAPSLFFKSDKMIEKDEISSPAIRLLNKYKNGGNK